MYNWVDNNIGKSIIILIAGISILGYLGEKIPMKTDKYKYRIISDNGHSFSNTAEVKDGCIKTYEGKMCGTYKILKNKRYNNEVNKR